MKLTKEKIIAISNLKKEPSWMLDFRLKSFAKFLELENPNFGPELNIDFNTLTYYKKVGTSTNNWDEVSCDVKDTFKTLGVIDAENKYLGGVNNQFESEVDY